MMFAEKKMLKMGLPYFDDAFEDFSKMCIPFY